MFRIALGSCSCAGFENAGGIKKYACEQLMSWLKHLQLLSYDQLTSLPKTETATVTVDGTEIMLATQIETRTNELLVVVQAFHSTLLFPTYISKHGVGKKFVEGFTIKPNGEIKPLLEELLWEYR